MGRTRRAAAEADAVVGDVGAADAVGVGVAGAGFVGSAGAWVGAAEGGCGGFGAGVCVGGDGVDGGVVGCLGEGGVGVVLWGG